MAFGLPDDVDIILELEPEELAMYLLRHFVQEEGCQKSSTSGNQIPSDTFNAGKLTQDYGANSQKLTVPVAEAWAWLVSHRLVVRSLEDRYPRYVVSRRGHAVAGSAEAERDFLASIELSKEFLHSTIADRSWPDYIRGDYAGAVFKAFREVEVAVRAAAGLPDSAIGVQLMEDAFKPNVGPLTAKEDQEAEQLALRRLFVGAIASYKNPSSHRHVELAPQEAAEMMVLASHLLSIVDARREAVASETEASPDSGA